MKIRSCHLDQSWGLYQCWWRIYPRILETNVLMIEIVLETNLVISITYILWVSGGNVNKFWQQQCQQTLVPTSVHKHRRSWWWPTLKLLFTKLLSLNCIVQVTIQYDCKNLSNWMNGILRNRSSNLSWMASLNFSYSCKVHVPNNQKLFNFCQIFTRHGSILAH